MHARFALRQLKVQSSIIGMLDLNFTNVSVHNLCKSMHQLFCPCPVSAYLVLM